jgi:hypothetical protein
MTWTEFNNQLEEILRDPTYIQYSLELRIYSYNWAIQNLLNFEPTQKTTILELGSRDYEFPDDFHEVVAVWDGDSWCNGVNFTSDSWTTMPSPVDENPYERVFWIFGNKLNFSKELTNDGLLFYHGKYTNVTDEDSEIDIPSSTVQAIVYWTIAGCLNGKLVQQAKVAIWGKTNQPGLTSESIIKAYDFYWNQGIKILKEITHKNTEMTLINNTRRLNV